MTNRLAKVALIGAALLAPTNISLADFEFAVSADQRQYAGSGTYDSSSYFRGAMEALDQLGAGEFMISPGDIDPVADQRWTIDQVLGTAYIWYPVVGNHELPGDGYENNLGDNMAYLRAYDYGTVNPGPSGCRETTYSFDHENVHFIALNEYCDTAGDSATNGDIRDHLYNWLVADIQATSQEHILVFGHEPAYPLPDMDNDRLRHQYDSLNQYPANRDRFWNLLRDEGVLAYIHGHTHNTSALKIDDVWQVDVGHARGAGDTGAASTYAKVRVGGSVTAVDFYRDEHDGTYDYLDIHHNRLLTGSCATVNMEATEDTYLYKNNPTTKYGGDSTLVVDGDVTVDANDYERSALIKWDVSSIPTGAFINTASIRVNVTNVSTDRYDVYQLLRDWSESQADWNDYASGSGWQTAGAQGSNDRGTVSLRTTPGSNSSGLETFSLNDAATRLIGEWVATPASNYGLIIQDYGQDNSYQFDSREGSTPPRLTVQYCGDEGEVIGDTVFEDIDGDGNHDDGEPGIAGVVVNLVNDNNGNGDVDTGDTVNESRTTDADGHYLFFGKPSGDYIVDVASIPSSYTLTTANEPFALTGYTPGTTANNVDFGYQQQGTGSIGGLVWNDTNNDNDPSGETGIGGVTVDLYRDVNGDDLLDAGDLYLFTQTTNGAGNYDFTALPDAKYIVDVTDTNNLLAGKFITGAEDPAATSLTGGADINNMDFGYVDVACSVVNMNAVADSHIDAGTEADINYGINTTIIVDGSPDLGALIRWDVSPVPAGDFIKTASIRLNITNESGDKYHIYQLLRNWNESQVTWNQYASGSNWQTGGAQGASDRSNSSLGTTPGSGTTGLETFNLNASGRQLIASWADSSVSNYGITIQDYTLSNSYRFDSSEGATPPRLTVEHCSIFAGAGSIGGLIWNDMNADNDPSGESGISGVTVDLFRDINNNDVLDAGDFYVLTQTTDGSGNYNFTGLPDAEYIVDITDTANILAGKISTGTNDPDAVTLAGGTSINNEDFGYVEATCNKVNLDTNEDTYIEAGTPAVNYGSSATLLVDGAPDAEDRATLIKWDVSSIPGGSMINSASIRLNVTNLSDDNYPVYQLLRNWVEGEATWNEYASSNGWQTVGALGANDRGTASLGVTPGSGATGLESFSLNATGLQVISNWVDSPSSNHGLIIQDYGQDNGYDFSSSDGGTAPRLTIEYCELNPTAATIGWVGLETLAVQDILVESGISQMNAAALADLLEFWDSALAASLADANRAELLDALQGYLDPDGDGQVVVLRWQTLEERGTIGFYAERQIAGKDWKRINEDMLPGLIDAPMGAEYLLFDPEVGRLPEYLYRLIEVEAWGTTIQHGPWLLRIKR